MLAERVSWWWEMEAINVFWFQGAYEITQKEKQQKRTGSDRGGRFWTGYTEKDLLRDTRVSNRNLSITINHEEPKKACLGQQKRQVRGH